MWYTWLVIFMKDIKYFILLFIFTGSIILMNHNYSWYQDTIVKVDEVKINKTSTEYNNNLKEKHYLETVYVHVLNGSEKVSACLSNRASCLFIFSLLPFILSS